MNTFFIMKLIVPPVRLNIAPPAREAELMHLCQLLHPSRARGPASAFEPGEG